MIVITVTRKPVEGTVASNAIKWGTGGIDVDASRIGHTEDFSDIKSRSAMKLNTSGKTHDPNAPSVLEAQAKLQSLGRWPANLILCVSTVDNLDEQSGISTSTGGRTVKRSGGGDVGSGKSSEVWWSNDDPGFGDTGGASRYFKIVGDT